jgi:hypothetical protein
MAQREALGRERQVQIPGTRIKQVLSASEGSIHPRPVSATQD